MADIDLRFNAKYRTETVALQRLEGLGKNVVGATAASRIATLHKLSREGVSICLAKAARFPARKAEIHELIEEFLTFGAKAVLSTGAQRGGDFLNNQLRGQWAERVVLSMAIDDVRLIPFGPSGAAMPGEEDHREVIMTFKEIHLLEGKRPDLIAFSRQAYESLSSESRARAESWPKRRLDAADEEIVRQSLCGVEVKNSSWHYERRRDAGGGPLSITVKAEEVSEIANWCERYALPVVFIQVLFDELYCMSFRRMQQAIDRGQLYRPGDYLLDEQTGEKTYHRFLLDDYRHRCGKVVFPNQSTAEVRVLKDGAVVPYINFQPAIAVDVATEIIQTELNAQ